MVSSMKQYRDDADAPSSVSLSLSLGAVADRISKKMRRGGADGEFVCKTCGRSFSSFQALGGHRTSHLRGRHGLALGLAAGSEQVSRKSRDQKQVHRCHVCGLEFEMGQALGGHMRRHREQEATTTAQAQPVLLQLFF
ncbi:zinc finger protein ZAT8-like [Hordeum vulgare subsp. vulgare]|uniref:C2H2-type domain-containing protein n=1 Tax=Hordeum vulgare subsp. vulgare TaxID=112509 RepID=A0A8I6YLV2_HORVV|nr:zinc finger protein ZAT8-like [Hordeum vulgare subsp. vulgare]